jgi:hypothetical protein
MNEEKNSSNQINLVWGWAVVIVLFLIGAGLLSLAVIGLERGEIMEISYRAKYHFRLVTAQNDPWMYWMSEYRLFIVGCGMSFGGVIAMWRIHVQRRHQRFLDECPPELRKDFE